MSINSLGSLKDRDKDTIPFRIEYIKTLLSGKKLTPLIELENTDIGTEAFVGGNPDLDTDINDTRNVLNKKILDFYKIINNIGGTLTYIKSGTTGHTFKGCIKVDGEEFYYGVKVVAYPKKLVETSNKKKVYVDNNIYDAKRPENAELMMIKLLSYFILKKQTTHIALPIGTFNTDIKPFIELEEEGVVDEDDTKYIEFVQKYKKGKFHNTVSILISEWANRGDLLDYIRNNYKKLNKLHWKVFFFQILSVLAVIQSKFPGFRHNDMKANNILIHKINVEKYKFKYFICGKEYCVPNIGYQVKLWDFDFACIPGVIRNSKVETDWTRDINVTPVQNRYYDMHYFFNTLVNCGFFPQFLKDDSLTETLKDAREFVERVVPDKYRSKKVKKDGKFIQERTEYLHERGRILVNDEYLTPEKVLSTDPYFEEFRVKPSPVKINRIKESVKNINLDKIISEI